jgi:hypothetical protein
VSVMDEIEAAFDTARKLLSGETTLEQLGESIFSPQPKGTCTKGVPCVLTDGHDGDCKPMRAVPAEAEPTKATEG